MEDSLIRAAVGGDLSAWARLVESQGPAVWEYASRLGARWQAVDASEAAFLNLADRCDEVAESDVVDWLRSETEDAMRTVQTATWRTPRPVLFDEGTVPEPVASIAEQAMHLRVDGARRFTPATLNPDAGSSDVVIPWRDGSLDSGTALVSWYRRYVLGEQRLDVSLLTDSARRLLLYPAPDVSECWLRTPAGSIPLEIDDLGYWRGTGVPEVPMSFAVTLSDGAVVTTEWVTV